MRHAHAPTPSNPIETSATVSRPRSPRRVFFRDGGGFTTVGAAVALLLVFALAFGGMRAVWVQTHSGDIQYVADAGALAADNAVAEFVTVGQVVDAALLSLSLLGLTVYIVSAVAAFIPGGQSFAAKAADVGARIFKLRDSAARSAIKGLNAAQKALPAICAVRAAACVEANAQASGADYHGFALPFPLEGVKFEIKDDSEVEEAAEKIGDEEEEVGKNAQEAQELQEKLDAAKEAAWKADCGKEGMNMRERAGHLAGLSGVQNPKYALSNWGFAIALNRAKAYYRARYAQEPAEGADGSPELVAESVARKRFYAYASATVSRGSVGKTSAGAELPNLVPLARNTDQVKQTFLYTEAIYPVSEKDGARTIHAYVACPGCAGGAAGYTAVSAVDEGSVRVCEHCKFRPSTLGRVPSASTSIDNGFEYYYRTVVEKAEAYRACAERAKEVQDQLKDSRGKMVKAVKGALESLAGTRYSPQPPGRYGCVCIVFAGSSKVPRAPFVSGGGSVGVRVAVSGATLAADPALDQGNVITEVGKNLFPADSLPGGISGVAFGAWGTALKAYTDGNDAVTSMLNKTLGAIPLVGTKLSGWAVDGFKGAVEKAGLKPAKLETYKPVLVNTSRIAEQDGGAAAQVLLKMKMGAQAYSALGVGDLKALAQVLDMPTSLDELLSGAGLKVLEFSLKKFGLGDADGKLTLDVPKDLVERYRKAMQEAQEAAGG